MKAKNGQILTLILIALMLTISAERGETVNSPRIIQASEILAKIAENKSINYNNVTIEGDIDFDNGSSELGKAIQVRLLFSPSSLSQNYTLISYSGLAISHQGFEINLPEPSLQNTSGLTPFMVLHLPNQTFVNSQITIKDSVIKGVVRFNNTIFYGTINFTNTTFCKDAYFIGSNFSKTANFERANFNMGGFCFANFSELAKFKGAIFNKLAFFSGARFNAKTDFKDVKFRGYADFFAANFTENKIVIENVSVPNMPERITVDSITAQRVVISLDNSKFKSSIFLRVFNSPEVTNGNTLMEAGSRYYYTTTESNLSFDNSLFNDTANFVGAKFNHNASFNGCRFNKDAVFSGANFGEYVQFVGSSFGGDSDFLLTNFTNDTHFELATFWGYVRFQSAIFMKDIDFENVHFLKYADFSSANFSGELNLDQTEFSTIRLENAVFGQASDLSLIDSSLIKSSSSLLLVKWDSISSHLVPSSSVYLAIIKNFMDIGNYEDGDDCYYQYREWRQNSRLMFDGFKYIDMISKITCGYGVRWTHTLLSGVGILILFGIIYLYRSKNNHVAK